MKRAVLSVCILALALILTACGPAAPESTVSADDPADGEQAYNYGGDVTLRILSGSENQELEGILDDFARERGVNIEMDYQGSLDIMRTLQGESIEYDAVWPASSLWLTAGDTRYRVKHAHSISVTPVVFGIRRSLAEELGFVGREVSVSDLLSAIESGQLNFCMTSATQSNSGCSAYIGFLYALLGNPDVITSESLQTPGLSEQITQLLSGVDRSSGSSDWLKDLFLTGGYDAMVNYECLIISANQELDERGEETLYAVYPYDGLSIADSPLGYVDNGDAEKEQAFLDLQEYLLSDEVQNEIQRTGRRTGYEGVSAENADVFRADWGVQPDRVLSPIRMPSTDVLMECLNLYQTEFRKPSLTVYCLDYSGSMEGERPGADGGGHEPDPDPVQRERESAPGLGERGEHLDPLLRRPQRRVYRRGQRGGAGGPLRPGGGGGGRGRHRHLLCRHGGPAAAGKLRPEPVHPRHHPADGRGV